MKKVIFTIILAFVALAGFSQSKEKPKATPPKYNYFVVVPIQDYQALVGALGDYKSSIIYNPNQTAEGKINIQQSIESYMKSLSNRVRVDSVKVDSVKAGK
jgi:hypothetical protein